MFQVLAYAIKLYTRKLKLKGLSKTFKYRILALIKAYTLQRLLILGLFFGLAFSANYEADFGGNG